MSTVRKEIFISACRWNLGMWSKGLQKRMKFSRILCFIRGTHICRSSSTLPSHYLHRALAKVLRMPPGHIRVIATPNGGGFGGKSDPFNHEIVVAKAALLLDRPVK